MSTPKRRKLDTADSPQPMSAFALRKRLLAERTPVEDPVQPEAQPDTSVQSVPSTITKRRSSRKSKATGNGTIDTVTPQAILQEVCPKDRLPADPIKAPDDAPNLSGKLSPVLPSSENDISNEVQIAQLSSFKPSKRNLQRRKNGSLLLKLVDRERLAILGSYGIRVESGEITIYGATLNTSQRIHMVDAPHCHALPVIRCVEDATIELCPHPGVATLRELGSLSPLFRKLWNDTPDSTFQILYTAGDGPRRTILQDLVSPPEWNRELARILKQSSKTYSVMITGPKSSGKSTLGKILTNRLITNSGSSGRRRSPKGIAVLDLDPGQPEYCIAGHIALVLVTDPILGSSFSHPLPSSEFRHIRSHALAAASPASNPELYLQCAMDLMTHYKNSLGSYPLIVNTPGWIQGTGLDLLVSLIGQIRPSEVIYMSETGPAEAVEALKDACTSSDFSTLPSQASQYTVRTAAHLRSMQSMSYFHATSPTTRSKDFLQEWSAQPLTTIPPLQVGYTGATCGIFGVMCYDYQAPAELLADAINGTIVAVVEIESSQAFRGFADPSRSIDTNVGARTLAWGPDGDSLVTPVVNVMSQLRDSITTRTPEGIPFIDTSRGTTLDPSYSQSIGLALIRGIDADRGELQLLTPLPLKKIQEIKARGNDIVLVSGKFDSPSWAYTEEFYCQSRVNGEEDTVIEAMYVDSEERVAGAVQLESDEDSTVSKRGLPPWIEVLEGNQARGAGARVLRVRRDLGKT
ncbi:hypothetical protein F5Y15DRAFT_382135 [Xylariaceae sp. FL0016]|nr:hypothetical protein F5Y15DRAFT_382135 [Xylariaceae sp. FL0016]